MRTPGPRSGSIRPTYSPIPRTGARRAPRSAPPITGLMPAGAVPPPLVQGTPFLIITDLLKSHGFDNNAADAIAGACQFRNINEIHQKVDAARLLLDWGAGIDAVAASFLVGIDEAIFSQTAIPVGVREYLSDRDRLLSYQNIDFNQAPDATKYQVVCLRNMYFSIAKSQDTILMLAAEDLVYLRRFDTPLRQRLTRAQYAFAITSYFLKYFKINGTGGKLEDVAFMHISPEWYSRTEEEATRTTGLTREERMEAERKTASEIQTSLGLRGEESPSVELLGRVKSIRSTAEKLAGGKKILDSVAFRCILESENPAECYVLLTHLSNTCFFGWEQLVSEYDDYITRPKPNGYQSLQACFVSPQGLAVEVQIRTRTMDDYAEYGPGSHESYKEGTPAPQEVSRPEKEIPAARFNAKKEELRALGTYFVCDEGGTIYKLVTDPPEKDLTVLDVAFAFGPEIGLRASNGSINGKIVGLDAKVTSGQSIGIIYGTTIQTARKEVVATLYARAILSAAERNSLDVFLRPGGEDSLEIDGRDFFRSVQEDLRISFREYFHKRFKLNPRLIFSLERIYRRKGFTSEKEFFMTMGLLSGNDRAEFSKTIKEEFVQSLTLAAAQLEEGQVATINLMVQNKPGVAYAIAKMARQHGLEIISWSQSTTTTQFSPGAIKLRYSTANQIETLLKSLEDLYQDIPPSADSRKATKPCSISFKFSARSAQAASVYPILKLLSDSSINIQTIALVRPPDTKVSLKGFGTENALAIRSASLSAGYMNQDNYILPGFTGNMKDFRLPPELIGFEDVVFEVFDTAVKNAPSGIFELTVNLPFSRIGKRGYTNSLASRLEQIPGVKTVTVVSA